MDYKAAIFKNRLVDAVPYIFGILGLIVPVLLTSQYPLTLLSITNALGPAGIISILLFLVSDRWATSWQQHQQQTEVFKQLKGIQQAQISLGNVRYLGSPDEAIKYVALCIQDAKICWNTYLHYGESDGFGYSKENHDFVKAAMREFLLDEKKKWIDVISDNSEEIRDRVAEANDGKKKPNYQCFRLNFNVPAINFIIFEYIGARQSEVIFGWGKHPKDQIGNVFITNGRLLVESFKALHGSMREKEVSVEFDPIKNDEIRRREVRTVIGDWFIGVGSIVNDAAPHGTPVEDVAIVTIRRNRGKVEVEGSTFNLEGKRIGRCTALAVRDNGHSLDILMEESGVFWRNKVTYVAIYQIITDDELEARYYDIKASALVKADCVRISDEDKRIIQDGTSDDITGVVLKYEHLVRNMT